jgi:hypothetical protein
MAFSFKISSGNILEVKDWNIFNSKLKIKNEWVLKMKNSHSDFQRHGVSTLMLGKERVEMIKDTQKVIDSYIVFIKTNHQL